MSTAQGMKVPHTFTDPAGSKLTIESGGLTMNSDGTFELKYKGKLNALTFNLTDEGTFTVAGSTVTFTPDDGDPAYTGRVSGKSIVVDDFKIAGVKWDLGFDGNSQGLASPLNGARESHERPGSREAVRSQARHAAGRAERSLHAALDG